MKIVKAKSKGCYRFRPENWIEELILWKRFGRSPFYLTGQWTFFGWGQTKFWTVVRRSAKRGWYW